VRPQAYLYDDPADLPRFLPFTQSRPIGELRYGASLLRERASEAYGKVLGHFTAPHLAAFTEPDAPPVVTSAAAGGPALFLRSSFVPGEPEAVFAGERGIEGLRLTDAQHRTVGAILMDAAQWHGSGAIKPSWPAVPIKGKLLAGVWDIVSDLPSVLRSDLEAIRAERASARVPAGCSVLGDAGALMVDDGAHVEPLVVFDTRNGPIWVQENAEIRSFSRLAGPLVVGRGTRVVGGQLRDSSLGPRCVVHGEVSNTTFVGYANKSHDGFLGHSIVGRWANLGAGTITSNLKNTYGTIRLNLGSERVETGLQFLGALIGDHAKTAIGTMLPTGCVVGTGANLFGTRRPDPAVPAFAWGTDEPGRVMACRMFLQTAGKVLPRREVELDEPTRRWLQAVWEHTTGQPCG